MPQICALCGREFSNNVSLDRHASSCRKRQRTASPVATRRSEESTSHTRKRPRTEPQDIDNGGPSNNDIREEALPTRSARSGRTVRIPRRLLDYVPHGDMSLAHVPPRATTPPERDDRSATPMVDETPSADSQPHPFKTVANKLGVFRRYTRAPSWHPKHEERLDLVCDSPTIDAPPPPVESVHEISPVMQEPFAPFPNFSTAMYMAAYFSGMDTKSEEHATLVAKTMQGDRIDLKLLENFNAHVENVRLDKYLRDEHPFQTQDGWRDATVHIRLPIAGESYPSEDVAPMLPIPHLYHRRITDIIRTVCSSKAAESFHFTPFTMYWSPDPDKPQEYEQVYADTYMSKSMIDAQTEVDNLSRVEGDTRERVALGLMMASDSAQLTNFGSASVWPIYLMFANQPKQERVRPSCHAVHHLAYVPSVSVLVVDHFVHLTNSHTARWRFRQPVSTNRENCTITRRRNPLQARADARSLDTYYGRRIS